MVLRTLLKLWLVVMCIVVVSWLLEYRVISLLPHPVAMARLLLKHHYFFSNAITSIINVRLKRNKKS
jgi:hypothetical protein